MSLGPFELLCLAFAAGLIAFWVWMLVDCATKEAPSPQKTVWLVVIAVIGVIGAPLYFLVRELPRKPRPPSATAR